MAVARLRGVPPSELLGIGCDWCAYCFDEALLVREAARAKRESDEAAQDEAQPSPQARERVLEHMRADGVIG